MHRRRFLQNILLGAAAVRASGVTFTCAAPKRRPNFVFFLIDDMGYADIGCFGSTFYQTPHIDRLAAQGMRFTSGYAASPVCSPTRTSIMTGRNPARLHLTNYLVGQRWPEDSPIEPVAWQHHLPHGEITIAEALKQANYVTAHIGKWHLGPTAEFWPENQGFDVNIGGCQSGAPTDFFWPAWGANPPIEGKQESEYLTDRLTDEAVKFIGDHRDLPFFLYLSHYAVHRPLQSRADYYEKYAAIADPHNHQHNPHYAGMVQSIDDSVGRIVETLEQYGLADDTVIFFTSDNGGLSVIEGPNTPATSNAPLRDGKGYLYEGGIREPWIVKWPGNVHPNSICDVPVISDDFFPTILEIAGVTSPQDRIIDGVSILPLLLGQDRLKRQALHWHYPHYSNQGGRPGAAIRAGAWKLIHWYEDDAVELYHLDEDIGESVNLAEDLPEKTEELGRLLHRWLDDVGAQIPAKRG